MSDPEIPLTPGAMNRGLLLLARRKREAILGSAALLGVLTGFYVVLSLASPRSHATDAAASVTAQPPPAPKAVPEPAVGGSSTTAMAVDVLEHANRLGLEAQYLAVEVTRALHVADLERHVCDAFEPHRLARGSEGERDDVTRC